MDLRVSRASSVIIHRVPAADTEGFLEWQRGISAATAAFPGYQTTDVYPPVEGQLEWVVILHFDAPESLQRWLESPARAEWLMKLRGVSADFELKTMPAGLGAWFAGALGSKPVALPPSWKIALSVLLPLYPLAMLVAIILGPYIDKLGLAVAMLISNILSVILLQWVVMPVLEVVLGPWLRARGREGRAVSIGGLILILLSLIGMMLLFCVVTGPTPAAGARRSTQGDRGTVSHITTHVLDTSRGRPAAGIPVRLAVREADGWREIGSGVTNADGRITDLGPAQLTAGTYRLEIEIGPYYRQTQTECFFSSVSLCFTLADPGQHYHVPLLLSPFAVSTYRGS